MTTIGDNLDRLIAVSGLRRQEVADRAGISRGYLSELINGKATDPSAAVVQRLAEALAVSVVDLMEDRHPPVRCRHWGIQWADPARQDMAECVVCGARFRVVPVSHRR